MNWLETFNDSYQRCLLNDRFFELFYENFWTKGERFRRQFSNINMQKQIRMLKSSIVFVMMANHSMEAQKKIVKYAQLHRPLGLEPNDIDIWFDSLVATVEEFDPKFDESVEQAWRVCFEVGLDIMKQGLKA